MLIVYPKYLAAKLSKEDRNDKEKKIFAKEMHEKYETTKNAYYLDFPDPKFRK